MTLDVVKQISILTPLTSSKIAFSPEQKHREAFEHIKQLLTREPLFGNLIDEKAEKYLWVDAATSSGTLGAVLAQKTYGTPHYGPIYLRGGVLGQYLTLYWSDFNE
jgi:hypothetical protein